MNQSVLNRPFFDHFRSKLFHASLLVGGTAIGAGMLALPVATAEGGFLPASLMYALCWLFSMATGFLFVEILHWLPKGANIVSMAQYLLGTPGKIFAWILYIFLFYSLTIAYISGGGALLQSILPDFFPKEFSIFIFTFFFASVVFFGMRGVSHLNFYLMLGLIIAYILFVWTGVPHLTFTFLENVHFKRSIFALPVIFTSFSYQGVLPTLSNYLNRDKKLMKKAIIYGTTIPFVAYLLWDFLIKGLVPTEGLHGLLMAKELDEAATAPLAALFPASPVSIISRWFAFFALTTSFIGVTLGLMDFLADSLKVKTTLYNRFWLSLLIYVPPVVIVSYNPKIFLLMLGLAGGYGCSLLLGLMPILMVFSGRYWKKLSLEHQVLKGGRCMLCILFVFILFEVVVEVFSHVR